MMTQKLAVRKKVSERSMKNRKVILKTKLVRSRKATAASAAETLSRIVCRRSRVFSGRPLMRATNLRNSSIVRVMRKSQVMLMCA
jgi:hypothetical protein